jgi:hypothetical protein
MSEIQEKVEPSTDSLVDLFPDVDKPHLSAVVQLLYAIGKDVEDIEDIEATPYVKVNVGGEEWVVLNDDEADQYAEDEVAKILDENGTGSFNVEWKDFVDNIDDFDNALAEKALEYIDAIREEPGTEEGLTELDQQMVEAGMATEEEFQVYLVNKWSPSGDAPSWYNTEYGSDAFKELASIDTEALAKHILIVEGRGSIISGTDQEELKLEHGYFAYQLS